MRGLWTMKRIADQSDEDGSWVYRFKRAKELRGKNVRAHGRQNISTSCFLKASVVPASPAFFRKRKIINMSRRFHPRRRSVVWRMIFPRIFGEDLGYVRTIRQRPWAVDLLPPSPSRLISQPTCPAARPLEGDSSVGMRAR